MDNHLTDEQLIEKYKAGDTSSADVILERYKELVRMKARFYFMLGAEHDDIMQEGMIGLFKAIQTFEEGKGASFKTYAEVCITSKILSAIKIAGRKKYAPLNEAYSMDHSQDDDDEVGLIIQRLAAGPDSDPEEAVVSKELEEFLTGDMSGFSSMEQIVIGHLMDGKGYKEIAEELGKTPKQIDNAIQRIKIKLKKILQP